MKRFAILTIFLAMVLAGCRERHAAEHAQTAASPAEASQAANLTPEQLGELGAKIKKDPSKADELLRQQGLDQKSFEEQIRRITEDPEASKRYAEAYRRSA